MCGFISEDETCCLSFKRAVISRLSVAWYSVKATRDTYYLPWGEMFAYLAGDSFVLSTDVFSHLLKEFCPIIIMSNATKRSYSTKEHLQ